MTRHLTVLGSPGKSRRCCSWIHQLSALARRAERRKPPGAVRTRHLTVLARRANHAAAVAGFARIQHWLGEPSGVSRRVLSSPGTLRCSARQASHAAI